MCVSCARCEQCEIKEIMKTYQILDCRTLTMKHWKEVINVVQKWSDEHQLETRLEHFLKMHPNARMRSGHPIGCKKCWDKPYIEGEF